MFKQFIVSCTKNAKNPRARYERSIMFHLHHHGSARWIDGHLVETGEGGYTEEASKNVTVDQLSCWLDHGTCAEVKAETIEATHYIRWRQIHPRRM